jgi:hypothetical protein
MKLATLEKIFTVLNAAGVRYLIAGGIAVNIHGYQRMTADLDLVIQLDTPNLLKAIHALSSLGYKPTIPAKAEQFADAATRQLWIETKNMKVFGMISTQYPETTVDIFVNEPFDFSSEYESALRAELTPDVNIRIVTIPTLIKMKQEAGRPRDLDDIEHLRLIQDETRDQTI